MAIFPGSAIPSGVTDYTIDQSLRFNNPTDPLLTRTPIVDGIGVLGLIVVGLSQVIRM